MPNYYPFENRDLHFDNVHAKIIEGGKVDLLVISQSYKPTISSALGGGLIPAIIEESIGNYNGPQYVLNNESKKFICRYQFPKR